MLENVTALMFTALLQMEREALLKKEKRRQEMDRLIEKLRATTGEEGALKVVVKTYLRGIDADVLMRLRELSAEAEAPEQALAYKQLGDGVLAAVTELDGKQAKEIREEIAFRLKDTVKLDVGNKDAAAAAGSPFDEFGSVEELMRNQSMRTSSIDQLTQEMMRNNSRGFSTIYAINLPQWLPREVRGYGMVDGRTDG
jgi:protoporphyrinogen oxidase